MEVKNSWSLPGFPSNSSYSWACIIISSWSNSFTSLASGLDWFSYSCEGCSPVYYVIPNQRTWSSCFVLIINWPPISCKSLSASHHLTGLWYAPLPPKEKDFQYLHKLNISNVKFNLKPSYLFPSVLLCFANIVCRSNISHNTLSQVMNQSQLHASVKRRTDQLCECIEMNAEVWRRPLNLGYYLLYTF